MRLRCTFGGREDQGHPHTCPGTERECAHRALGRQRPPPPQRLTLKRLRKHLAGFSELRQQALADRLDTNDRRLSRTHEMTSQSATDVRARPLKRGGVRTASRGSR